MPPIAQTKHISLFYPLGIMLLAMAAYASFYFWYPHDRNADRVIGVIDAPTVVTEAPFVATDTLALIAGKDASASSSATLFPEATTSAIVALAEIATMTPQSVSSTGVTTSPTKKAAPKTTISTKASTKTLAADPHASQRDGLPPSTPQDLIIQHVGEHEIAIGWSPSLDNSGVVAYKIFRDGELVALTTKAIQIFTNLAANTKYTFGVVAYDQSGNMSKMNNILGETLADTSAAVSAAPNATSSPAVPVAQNLCGNGAQDIGEECDDGNRNDHDMCTNKCKAATCGDGVVNEALEQCDDGNQIDGDYCTNQCQTHTPTALQISIWGLSGPTSPPASASPGTSPASPATSPGNPSPTPPPTTPTTYTVNVTSAGNYSPSTLALHVGDSIKFVYTPPVSSEVVTRFTPATIGSVIVDQEFTQRTVTVSTTGTWTFKVQDHNGNTGTLTVQ